MDGNDAFVKSLREKMFAQVPDSYPAKELSDAYFKRMMEGEIVDPDLPRASRSEARGAGGGTGNELWNLKGKYGVKDITNLTKKIMHI